MRWSPTAIKAPGAEGTKGLGSSLGVDEDKAMDVPFFANDGLEGSKKSDRRLATFKLHACLDLENVKCIGVAPFHRPEEKRKKH